MSIPHKINQILSETNMAYHEISVKLGMTDSEAMILYYLFDCEKPVTQSDIMKCTGISKQTIHSSVRKMIADGIIRLEGINEKSKRIIITENGKAFIQEKVRPILDLEEAVFSTWTAEETVCYVRLLQKYKEQFKELVENYAKK